VNTPIPGIAAAPTRFGLIARLVVIAVVLAAEILVGSYLVQATPVDMLRGAPEALRLVQHWLFRFIIAYAVSLSLLAYLRGAGLTAALSAADQAPVRLRWVVVHVLLLAPFLYLSSVLYTPYVPFAAVALAWHLAAGAATLALFAALAPASVWITVLRKAGGLPLFAIVPAAAAVAVISLSQMLWQPAAQITFRLVQLLIKPLLPTLQSDPVALTLATDRFAVQIAEVCSGLEGVGLMLAFCAAWLWFFRREYYFPRALVVIPLGVLAVFLLNAVRIAVLILIGNAGYDRVATVGFHSQAGWIAFNLAGFGVAILAHTNPWLSRVAAEKRAGRTRAGHSRSATNPTAAYLMPLLAILAAGMIAHALSADFEVWYPLRLLAALAVLWFYRGSYAGANLTFSWRGPVTGIFLFGLWVGVGAFLSSPASEPLGLAALSPAMRGGWIGCRVIAAVVTVPIAEELAYRGYLLRRLTTAHFESAPFSAARWPQLGVSALAFGIMHGQFWIAGMISGLVYGLLAMRTNKLGESIAAHATTNALLAAAALLFGQWQLF
jgi:exosortase E/protease (VPEID-CTERM system)